MLRDRRHSTGAALGRAREGIDPSRTDQSTTCSMPSVLLIPVPTEPPAVDQGLKNGGLEGKKSQLSPDLPSMAGTAPTVFSKPVK